MAAQSFNEFYRRVLEHEGRVNEDVPGDNGGPTRWGITIFDFADAVGKKVPVKKVGKEWVIDRASPKFAPLRDELFAVTEEWIKNRYRTKYWDSIRADELPRGVDLAVADFGVNAGESLAVKYLQRICGNAETGRMDDETLREAAAIPAPELINHFCDMRVDFYEAIIRRNPKQIKFKRGWLNRVRDVRQAGLTWAAQEVQPPPVRAAKAALIDETPNVSVVKEAAKSKSNWWIGFGGIGAWVEQQFGFVKGLLPDAQQSVEDVVSPLASLGGMLKLNMSSVIATVALVTLVVVFIRHTRDKVELAKAKAETGE